MSSTASVVVVSGANGFVGARICGALVERGARVRVIVRRTGTAPPLPGVVEVVGDFTEPALAATVVPGTSSVVTTVHPMGSDRVTQQRIGVTGMLLLVRAAASAAGIDRLIHIWTAAVFDRSSEILGE